MPSFVSTSHSSICLLPYLLHPCCLFLFFFQSPHYTPLLLAILWSKQLPSPNRKWIGILFLTQSSRWSELKKKLNEVLFLSQSNRKSRWRWKVDQSSFKEMFLNVASVSLRWAQQHDWWVWTWKGIRDLLLHSPNMLRNVFHFFLS